jgi:hypothetical protein
VIFSRLRLWGRRRSNRAAPKPATIAYLERVTEENSARAERLDALPEILRSERRARHR